MKVRAISVTNPMIAGTSSGNAGDYITADANRLTAEDLMVYCARVSSPQNQDNHATGEKLLRYCFDNGHWSVFEMADFTVEIETSVAVSRQLLRHKSFSWQEFSQRYADASQLGFEDVELRKQDKLNRQNSLALSPADEAALTFNKSDIERLLRDAEELYQQLIFLGVAKECARMILPMCTTTRLYMKGSVRSWLTYFMVRLDKSTQKEHREVAAAIFQEFKKYFPVCAGLLEGEVK